MILNIQKKQYVITNLIELIKKNQISGVDKEKIYIVVMNLSNKTDKQKERFTRYFGLKPKDFKRETLAEIAKSYKCNTSAIKCSIISIKAALHHIPEDDFKVLVDIYEKYRN